MAECGAMCIENPIPLKLVTDKVGMYDQIINPYMFGDPFTKATCFDRTKWERIVNYLQLIPEQPIVIELYMPTNPKRE